MAQNSFFTYKGLPLVRKGNELYYGNMGDEYVVFMQIKSTSNVAGHDIADKILIKKMATDPATPIKEVIKKTAERTSLYEALDVASAWLHVGRQQA